MIGEVGPQVPSSPAVGPGGAHTRGEIADPPVLGGRVNISSDEVRRPVDGGGSVVFSGAQHHEHVDVIAGVRAQRLDHDGTQAGDQARAEYDGVLRRDRPQRV